MGKSDQNGAAACPAGDGVDVVRHHLGHLRAVQDQLDDPAAVLAHGGLHRAVNAGGHRFDDLVVVDHRRAGPDGSASRAMNICPIEGKPPEA